MSAVPLLALHDELCKSAKDLMTRKNYDYTSGSGDSFANFRGSTYLGIDPVLGVMLRMQDKMMRIKTFAEKGELKVKDEGAKDALVDLINYTVLMYGLIQEKQATPATKTEDTDANLPDTEEVNIYRGDPVPLHSGASARQWLDKQERACQDAEAKRLASGGTG